MTQGERVLRRQAGACAAPSPDCADWQTELRGESFASQSQPAASARPDAQAQTRFDSLPNRVGRRLR